MTKRERVIAAINKQETDGVPSGFFIHFPHDCIKGEAAVKAHVKYFEDTDMAMVKIMNENLVPDMPEIKTAEDYSKMPGVDGDAAFINDQIALTKEILKSYQEDGFTVGTLHGIVASAIHPMQNTMGYEGSREKLCEFLRKNPEKALEGMEKIADAMCVLARKYIKAGLDGVYYAALGGEKQYFTDEEFKEWIRPFDLKIMKAIKEAGGYCILHICQKNLNMNRYEGYEEYCDAVNWGVYDAPYSLEEGKELFHGKTIMGGMENRSGVLVDGSEADVCRVVRELIETFGRTGFILGADCTLATEQDLRKVRAAVETARSL